MIARTTVLLALLLGVLIQYVAPGQPIYQYGWYSFGLAGLFVIALFQSRFSNTSDTPGNVWTSGIALLRIGMGILALAGVANGLLAPDPQLVVAAPGAAFPLTDPRGSLVFSQGVGAADVVFMNGSAQRPVCGGARLVGSFEMWCVPRDVVAVQAYGARGRLTVTQPNGSTFLSPVLLFTATQSIAGIPLPFDSFAVPAAHRIINAVYFDARHAAALRGVSSGVPAVLLAADDDAGEPLPHAIQLVASGERVTLAGVHIVVTFLRYPAVRIVAVPLPPLVLLGVAGIGIGMFLHIRERRASRQVT